MLEDALKLRELIARYGAMHRLDSFTEQTRGSELNKLIADVLRCYGISATASVRQGYGEIDVAFTIEGIRFVLEAKWEKEKADSGKISKLQRRVRQRLVTTLGVFVSMAGYTPDGVAEANIGEQLAVLLLDRRHLEAMISGIVPPQELFNLLLDKASYEGRPYHSLEKLLPQPTGKPTAGFGAPEQRRDLVRKSHPQIAVEPLLHDLPMSYIGLAAAGPDKIILNYPEGFVLVDPERETTEWYAPVPASYGHTLPMEDGSLLFHRQNGVGMVRDGRIHSVAGGFLHNAVLFEGENGDVWALDGGNFRNHVYPGGVNAAITKVGRELGDQAWTPTTVQGSLLADAVWIDRDRVAGVGSGLLAVINPRTGASTQHLTDLSNTMSLCKLNNEMVLTVAGGKLLAALGLDGQTVLPLAEFNLDGSASELCAEEDGSYLMYTTYSAGPHTSRGVVLRIRLPLGPLMLIPEGVAGSARQ